MNHNVFAKDNRKVDLQESHMQKLRFYFWLVMIITWLV